MNYGFLSGIPMPLNEEQKQFDKKQRREKL